jgi:type VII secretion-associated protein (TIGR03931 family)
VAAPPVVLELSDETVRVVSGGTGQRPARALIEAAMDWIDEPVGLFEDRPVAVADMWRSLVETLLGPRCEAAVVVHPADWSRTRVDRVVAAVNTVADHIEVMSADRLAESDAWAGTGGGAPSPGAPTGPRSRRRRRMGLLLAAAVLIAGGAVVGIWRIRPAGSTVVDGRMAVRIPAHWDVQRVTGGPGSRRLEATAPADPALALHLTWSYAPETSLADAADTLERAIGREPPGVFADLRGEASIAGRAAVTYREFRPGRVITWIVVLSGATRISIGCQSPPEHEAEIRAACDDAVRSAREV